MDEFLTVAEGAELLKLNQQTVRNWIDRGELPAYHVGRRVPITCADLDRIIEHRSTRATAAATSRPAPGSAPSLWDGEVPQPAVPGNEPPVGGGRLRP